MTGRGAGLTSEGLVRKINAIKKAIALNEQDPEDAIDVLAKVGGLDIAAARSRIGNKATAPVPSPRHISA